MPKLLLNKTEEATLLKAIFPSTPDQTDDICYIVTRSYHSSDGGGGTDILGVFLSKDQAAKAFLKRAKDEFNGLNAEYAEEGEIYFEEEPILEAWDKEYVFQSKNHLYDDYVWGLTQKTIGEMKEYRD